jgi:hypothetical protein
MVSKVSDVSDAVKCVLLVEFVLRWKNSSFKRNV